jgi:dTDP-glucose pyrophosphorylase
MAPTLLILAAGLGSRYGSLKQIDRIGPSGERIIDYSVYDAVKAGFGKIIYVIRKSFEKEFREVILDELPNNIQTDYVFQEIDAIPACCKYSDERVKPWGTGHALLTAAQKIKEPFAVINADDFYGPDSFNIAYHFLNSACNSRGKYALIGYKLKNTVSINGPVSRGICEVDSEGYMTSIIERTKIKASTQLISYENADHNWLPLTGDEIVSMNFFAFTPDVFNYYQEYFIKFLKQNGNDLKAEFYLPWVINNIIQSGCAKVKILETKDNWFGLTYKEDKISAGNRINELIKNKTYPVKLWEK